MKKVTIILIMLFVICTIIAFSFAEKETENPIMEIKNAWKKTNCQAISTNLNIYSDLPNAYATRDKMEQLLVTLIQEVAGLENPGLEWLELEDYQEVSASIKLAEEEVLDISLQTFNGTYEDDSQTNLMINIEGSNEVDKLLNYQNIINKIIYSVSGTGQLNCSILGFIEKEVAETDVINNIAILLKHLHCDVTDFYIDNTVLSICGNSPLLEQMPYGWSFNMQVSARKDEKGNYYFWLGYPAIASSY